MTSAHLFQSSVCEKIMEQLGQNEVAEDQKQVHIVSMESFYRRLTEEQRQAALRGKYNFDHPGKIQEEIKPRESVITFDKYNTLNPCKLPLY